MDLIAFDAKNFNRTKIIQKQNPENSEKYIEETVGFFSPLGVGVAVKNYEIFDKVYLEFNRELSDEFNLPFKRPFYSSHAIKSEIGLRRAIPFVDKLIQRLDDYIEHVFVSYVILPPKDIPYVEVGGNKNPVKKRDTYTFLRDLSPMFSYLTAWQFVKYTNLTPELWIDNFSSKSTPAWNELLYSGVKKDISKR